MGFVFAQALQESNKRFIRSLQWLLAVLMAFLY